MKYKVFIDGSEGTTGLKIYERLGAREDIDLMSIPAGMRKDAGMRRQMINESDITFLCLPDEAARESAELADNEAVRLIDASTAHRTLAGWSYGFPELSGEHRLAIQTGKRISVPGCHATGFIALVYPLIREHILPADYPVTIGSLSGYSGAGKKMIGEYERPEREAFYDAPRLYALGQEHKHLREMQKVTGLSRVPIFSPVIADYYRGMVVSVPLFSEYLSERTSPEALREFYAEYYAAGKLIEVMPVYDEAVSDKFLNANACSGWDGLKIHVTGNRERIVLAAQFDNLGKGASGAAIQCMNIALGCEETKGLVL